MKKDRDGVKAGGKERVKEMQREERAAQVSAEVSHSLIIERSSAMERDNQSACLASVLC